VDLPTFGRPTIATKLAIIYSFLFAKVLKKYEERSMKHEKTSIFTYKNAMLTKPMDKKKNSKPDA
jgi:hypothetical protein